MKKMMFVGLMVSVFATAALADTVSQNTTENGKTIDLNGGAGGVSQEIFTIMDKAGVQADQYMEGKSLHGKNLASSVFFVNGARYNVTLTIDTASTAKVVDNDFVGKTTITLTGAVAEELLNDMAKAGVPHRPMMDAAEYDGTNVTCNAFYLAGGRYTCTIQAH